MATKIVDTLEKQQGETRLFGMSFENKLNDTETITSVDSIVIEPLGPTATEHSITNGVVNLLLSGGTPDKAYKVTVTVSTDFSQILENEGWLKILEK